MKFCLHNWGKYGEPVDTAHDHAKVQVRYCSKCNKCQVEQIKQPWNIWFAASSIKTKKEATE